MLLGFDTATDAVTVALHDGTEVLASYDVEDRTHHGELLAPAIERVLSDAGVRPASLTGIAVGVGPGPYTGLRIGLVTATTMATALGIDVVGVCTLDILAAAVDLPGPFIVATDARRREVFWAPYASPLQRSGPLAVGRPETVDTGVPVAGNGPSLYPEHFPHAVPPRLPSAARLCQVVSAGSVPLVAPTPIYLRRPDAVAPGAPKRVT